MFPRRVVIKSLLLSVSIIALMISCVKLCYGQDSGWETEQRGKSGQGYTELPQPGDVDRWLEEQKELGNVTTLPITEAVPDPMLVNEGKQVDQPAPIRVGVSLVEPMVMEDGNDGLTGFDIELWQYIASELGVDYKYEPMEFSHMFEGLQRPTKQLYTQVDVAISGITITEEREETMDFSHAYWNSGLSIAVRKQAEPSFLDSLASIWNSKKKYVYWLAVFILTMAHILWLIDKKDDEHISSSYIPGIFEACWFTLVTMTTVGYGDFAPKKWASRVITSIVMLAGIGLFGIIIAELSSDYTIKQLRSDIAGPKDLHGKTVATLRGTTSVSVLEKYGAVVVEVGSSETMFDKLMLERVDAVVYDTPTIMYYVNKYNNRLMMAGDQFEPQHYGIALPQESELREEINRALLKVQEDGRYAQLYRKYFNGE